jgi:hypothetical protein
MIGLNEMSNHSSRPIRFRDYLPEVLRGDEKDPHSFQNRFLQAFEDLFEELQGFIEGVSPGDLRLIADSNPIEVRALRSSVESSQKIRIKLKPPHETPPTFPVNTFVTLAGRDADSTTLAEEYPGETGKASLFVRDADFARLVKPGSEIVLHAGGVPDLFNPDLTPPPQFAGRLRLDDYEAEPDSTFLNFLASWIGLPLRDELIPRAGETDLKGRLRINDTPYERRKARWNRHLMRTAVGIYPRRGTRAGVEGMLRAWLKDDLVEERVIVTDLLRTYTDIDAVFRLGERARLGVDTVLGEGPPFFFIVDLTPDPTVRGLRNPAGIDVFLREARYILETETPAHTYYELRVRVSTMQLAPPIGSERAGEIYAQVGETTQFWDQPAVYRVGYENRNAT